MMADEIRFIGDMQRLELKPGDRLVLSTPANLSPDDAKRLREAVAKVIPGHEVIVLSNGLKLGILEAA